MLAMLAGAFAVLTGAALFRAWEEWMLGNPRGYLSCLAMGAPLLLITVAAIWLLLRQPNLLWWTPPTGFGVEWQCTENVPPSARVCFRH